MRQRSSYVDRTEAKALLSDRIPREVRVVIELTEPQDVRSRPHAATVPYEHPPRELDVLLRHLLAGDNGLEQTVELAEETERRLGHWLDELYQWLGDELEAEEQQGRRITRRALRERQARRARHRRLE